MILKETRENKRKQLKISENKRKQEKKKYTRENKGKQLRRW